ncbi:MAG: N-acetylmuramic acid 6-phosphate etherase [Candidatus Eremiobacteraeota bacterium]|nr:N-acetylmuramic acid 6-phosphate etherase [Candidatus Eremiobacteraeota bacterium]
MSDALPATEAIARRPALDTLDIADCVGEIVAVQQRAVAAVEAARDEIAAAARAAADKMARGGSWHTIGAGSSGRIAALDAVELHPTFGLDPRRLCIHLAGGEGAFLGAIEGAEDNEGAGERDMACVHEGDVAIALSASGRAPYVRSALRTARARGVLTIAIANDRDAPLLADAAFPVFLETGAEPLAGSTRLVAGTAQKIALNALSTAVMVALGTTYENMMVDVVVTNEKLRDRAERIVMRAVPCERDRARALLADAGASVKLAIAMAWLGNDARGAGEALTRNGGRLRDLR